MVAVLKGAKCEVKFKILSDYIHRHPVNLERYNDFICAVTEDGKLLIEKKFSTNGVKTSTNIVDGIPYIITVVFNSEDTKDLSLNPASEERQRTLELFGIGINDAVTRFLITDFNLEGSGYYVRRNRS
jgi:hypothetical protein